MNRKQLVKQLADDIIKVMRKHKHFIERPVVLDIEKAVDDRIGSEAGMLTKLRQVMRAADVLSSQGFDVRVTARSIDHAATLFDTLERLQAPAKTKDQPDAA